MIICRCNEVSKKEIEGFLKKHPHSTFDDIIEKTGASTNCGRCRNLLERTFEKLKADQVKSNQLRIDF